jgi:putrescine transport system ATP-binding protein
MSIQDRTGVTFIVVTHDQEEAMTLSSRMAVMDKGRIMQIGTANDIYEFPKSRFVADFIGSINLFDGKVAGIGADTARIELPGLGLTAEARSVEGLAMGASVSLAVRPEKLRIARHKPEGPNVLPGTVDGLAYFGKDSLYRVRLSSGQVVSVNSVNARRGAESERVADWEDEVWLSFDPAAAILLRS